MYVNLADAKRWTLLPGPAAPVLSNAITLRSSAHFGALCQSLGEEIGEQRPVINLCENRLMFALGFCATLFAGGTNLLPQNRQRETLATLQQRFPNALTLIDGGSTRELSEDLSLLDLHDFLADAPQDREALLSVDLEQLAARVYTSGSTGQPKEILKPWKTLIGTAQMLARRFELASWPGPILATVPSQHMYGLEMTLLLALASGCPVLDVHPFFPADIARHLRATPGSSLVTTPFHLKSLLDSGIRELLIPNIVCATAPLAIDLARRAEEVFGARVMEIYGCSEAGSVATRRPTHSENWVLLDGFHFDRQQHNALRGDHLDNPVTLEDQIEVFDNGEFRLLGRSSEMLNVGGKRSSLSEITARLLALEGVSDAAVFTPGDSERPAAIVVGTISPKQIASALAAHLDPVFIPRPIKIVEKIPRNATGKPLKRDLEECL